MRSKPDGGAGAAGGTTTATEIEAPKPKETINEKKEETNQKEEL